MAINYANIYDTERIAQALHQIDVLPQIMTFFPIPGGDGVREVQWDYLDIPNGARIVDDYGFIANRCELFSANRHQFLIETDIEFLLRDFNLQTGNEGRLPQLSINEFAYKHQPHRAEYCIMGDAKFAEVEGAMATSATGSLQNPASCEATAGTATATGAVYSAINPATLGGATFLDYNTAMTRFAVRHMLHQNGPNDIVLLLHPIAAAILESCNEKIGGTATTVTTASERSAMDFYKAHCRVFQFECVDTAYTGATTVLTNFVFLANPKDNFWGGVGKALTIDPWWENEDRSAKRSRISEAIVPIANAPYKSGTTYYKPVEYLSTNPYTA